MANECCSHQHTQQASCCSSSQHSHEEAKKSSCGSYESHKKKETNDLRSPASSKTCTAKKSCCDSSNLEAKNSCRSSDCETNQTSAPCSSSSQREAQKKSCCSSSKDVLNDSSKDQRETKEKSCVALVHSQGVTLFDAAGVAKNYEKVDTPTNAGSLDEQDNVFVPAGLDSSALHTVPVDCKMCDQVEPHLHVHFARDGVEHTLHLSRQQMASNGASEYTGSRKLVEGNGTVIHTAQHGTHVDSLVMDDQQLFWECQGQWSLHGTRQSTQHSLNASPLKVFHTVSDAGIPWWDFFSGNDDPRVNAALPVPKTASVIRVENMCCAAELPAVTTALEGWKHRVSVVTKQVYVYTDKDLAPVVASLTAAGFPATVQIDGTCAASTRVTVTSVFKTPVPIPQEFLMSYAPIESHAYKEDGSLEIRHNPFLIAVEQIAKDLEAEVGQRVKIEYDGILDWNKTTDEEVVEEITLHPRPTVILCGVMWVVSMLSLLGGNWAHLKWVALFSVALGIPPIALKTLKVLYRHRFDTNCLMFFASIGAVALQDYTEAAAVVFLFALSEWLELRATTRARRALSALVQLRPAKADWMQEWTGNIVKVPASVVPVGTMVSVKCGDKIPCDGVVIQGASTVDESSLTGESRPIRKSPDSIVSGGTVNSGASPLVVRTTCMANDSAVSRLIRLVEEAQANRSETEKLVDRFAQIYTPVVVLAALLMCTIPWAFGKGREWTHNGLILIVVACPCALIISTPVSYVAGLAALAQKGVLVKGGACLEALAGVRYIYFDKTGTLTNGKFALLQMRVLTKHLCRKAVFRYLAVMEEHASHPVAQAILAAARNEKVSPSKEMLLEKHCILDGEGVVGVVNGFEVHVGNERLFERLGLLQALPIEELEKVAEWKAKGGTVGYMSVEGCGIVCSYNACDSIREEAAEVLRRLKRRRINITMLTGDNSDAAHTIGKQIGLNQSEVKSKLLPEEKLQYVKSRSKGSGQRSCFFRIFQRKEMVMMVGDGLNDAPALAAADLGMAMGSGAALSMDTSDITLLDSNLRKIELSVLMGRRVTAKIVQNVFFSIAVKAIVLGFALAGMTELWAAIASDVGAMLLVTLNSMMLLPKRNVTPLALKSTEDDVEEGKASVAGSTNNNVSAVPETSRTDVCCRSDMGCCVPKPPSSKKGM